MSDFPFAAVRAGLAGGPLTYNGLVVKLDARLRTGEVHPDLNASTNHMLGQGLIRWRPCPCTWEHDPDRCELEIAS
jgi:hypothetical protein